MTTQTIPTLRPSDNGLRAIERDLAQIGIRAAGDGESGPVLFGHFAVFNRWTEIDSWFEGNFLERIAPGAFKKTMREQRDSMRVLLQHGMDPEVGDKPIAAISELREDDVGAYYEAGLFEGLPALVMDGLRADQYGASFRFKVMRDEYVEEPGVSDYNPKGLPERTLKELRVPEFGPVTFPAYAEASAGVRSVSDDFITELVSRDPERVRELLSLSERATRLAAASEGEAAEAAAAEEQDTATAPGRGPTPQADLYPSHRKDTPSWRL